MTGKFRDSVRQRQRKPHPQTAQRAVGEGQLSAALGGHRVADDGQPQAVASDPLIQAAAALQHLLAA